MGGCGIMDYAMKTLSVVFSLSCLCGLSTALGDETLMGKVTRIIDGDSILVTDSKSVEYEVQLEGIDAPELKQEFGKESTEGLSKLLKDKMVRITWKSKDNFERLLAQVYDGDKHINMELIKTGMAWHFKRYNNDEELAKILRFMFLTELFFVNLFAACDDLIGTVTWMSHHLSSLNLIANYTLSHSKTNSCSD